jgi:hypothetical protein
MDLIWTMWSRIAAHFRSRELDDDLDKELRTHVDPAIEENLKRGMTDNEARTAQLRSLVV